MCVCASFQPKQTALTFSAQICPKVDLGLAIQKIIVGVRISIFKKPCVPIFRKKGQLWLFRSKFAQKWILGSEFQKYKSEFRICTSKIPCVCTNFQLKWTTLTFLALICPKRKLRFEIQDTNVGIRISILEIPCVSICRKNGQLWVFGPKFAQKWILGSKF